MNIIKKTNKIIYLFACYLLTANLAYSQPSFNDCSDQFSTNSIALDQYHMQQVVNCTPYFGSNSGSTSYGDLGSIFSLLAAGASWESVGAGASADIMYHMLDELNNYWDCVGDAEHGYTEALDLLGSAFDDCWEEAENAADYN